MKFITDFLNKRKENKIAKKIATLQERAMQYQRNGDLREYANIHTKSVEFNIRYIFYCCIPRM